MSTVLDDIVPAGPNDPGPSDVNMGQEDEEGLVENGETIPEPVSSAIKYVDDLRSRRQKI